MKHTTGLRTSILLLDKQILVSDKELHSREFDLVENIPLSIYTVVTNPNIDDIAVRAELAFIKNKPLNK